MLICKEAEANLIIAMRGTQMMEVAEKIALVQSSEHLTLAGNQKYRIKIAKDNNALAQIAFIDKSTKNTKQRIRH